MEDDGKTFEDPTSVNGSSASFNASSPSSSSAGTDSCEENNLSVSTDKNLRTNEIRVQEFGRPRRSHSGYRYPVYNSRYKYVNLRNRFKYTSPHINQSNRRTPIPRFIPIWQPRPFSPLHDRSRVGRFFEEPAFDFDNHRQWKWDQYSQEDNDLDEEYVPQPLHKHQRRMSEKNYDYGYSYPNRINDQANLDASRLLRKHQSQKLDDQCSTDEFSEHCDSQAFHSNNFKEPEELNFKPEKNIFMPAEFYEKEAFVSTASRYVLIAKQRSEFRVAVGVWFSNGDSLNFSEVMPESAPLTTKAALIVAGERCISRLKKEGFTKLRINMESSFLVQNVACWTKKFMADACNGNELKNVSNWDEYKYSKEIEELCKSSQGMVVQWVHLPEKDERLEKAKQLAVHTLPNDSYKGSDN